MHTPSFNTIDTANQQHSSMSVDEIVSWVLHESITEINAELYTKLHTRFKGIKHITHNRRTGLTRFIPYEGAPMGMNILYFKAEFGERYLKHSYSSRSSGL